MECMIHIDGSKGEGGGQMLRTALALSCLTGKPFKIINIRKGRESPGLKHQHLSGIIAAQKLCDANVKGAELGSMEAEFVPGMIKGGTLSVDIGTAGSVTLLLQSVLIPSLFSGKRVRLRIKGGTDVPFSMPVDYLSEVFIPHLRRYADIELKVDRRGYVPKGGGRIDLKIKPFFSIYHHDSFEDFHKEHFDKERRKVKLLKQETLFAIKGVSHASKDLEKAEVTERQARAAKMIVSGKGCPVSIRLEYCDTFSTGSGITLWAICSEHKEDPSLGKAIRLGGDSLGKRGKRAEVVGEEAGKMLLKEVDSSAPVDSHLADNLIPLLGLFGGSIKASEVTQHTRTNIEVVKKFLDVEFDIAKDIISCKRKI